MKKQSPTDMDDDLRPEYDLRQMLSGAEQGKYAERFREGTNLVLLEPDIAAVFPNEQAVNDALRLVVELTRIPIPPKKKTRTRR